MNPPLVARPLAPSLSSISATFDSHKKPIPTSNCAAKDALNSIFQSQQLEIKTRPDENSPQSSSYNSPVTGNATTLISTNLVASQWSTLVSVVQNVNNTSETAGSHISTPRAPLLSAQSIDSLPHALPSLTSQLDSSSSSQPLSIAEGTPISRRKLSLSRPRDTPNSAPNMHRRPVTGNNRAGIFHSPACREFSGFGSPAVAAAEERWRRGEESNSQNPRHQQDATEDGPGTSTRRKATLSTPHDTEKNSSPKLHFRGHTTSGTFTEWICREQSGFANPTYAASTQRWQTPVDSDAAESQAITGAAQSGFTAMNRNPMRRWGEADEREGQGRRNGLPTANSWVMNKTHVLNISNCFNLIGNGFGLDGRTSAQPFGEPLDIGTSPLISFGPVSNRRTERADEFDQWSSKGGKSVPSMAAANQAVEAHLSPRIVDIITPFPVPAGLIAASIQAQRQPVSSKSSEEDNLEATEESIAGQPSFNKDGLPVYFKDLDYRQGRNYRGSVWPQRSAAPRNSGLGEGSGFPPGERTERKGEGLTKERERHIKGTHLPLRTTKGNALGLRSSQARNTGFGEGSGYPSVDKYGDRFVEENGTKANC